MAQLFPNGEPVRQAKGNGRVAQKSATVLYMAPLEKTGTETKESDQVRCTAAAGLPMEPIPNGGMGDCPKPDFGNDHYFGAIAKKRLRSVAYVLRKSCPTS